MKIHKLISHRGNISGPDIKNENEPSYILNSIGLGFDCEIDVWYIDNVLLLGHDKPQHKISLDFLLEHKEFFWIHCKNFEALNYLNSKNEMNYFWHEEDRFTITSKGFIWTYPENIVGKNSVIVDNRSQTSEYNCYGICSDYVELYK
tara:strand:+ start:30796 stop:31236 length:441 start_codon:yes stop_codon:yes gene_type:complete